MTTIEGTPQPDLPAPRPGVDNPAEPPHDAPREDPDGTPKENPSGHGGPVPEPTDPREAEEREGADPA